MGIQRQLAEVCLHPSGDLLKITFSGKFFYEIAFRMFLSGLESSEPPEPAGKVLEPFFFATLLSQVRMPAQVCARTHIMILPGKEAANEARSG